MAFSFDLGLGDIFGGIASIFTGDRAQKQADQQFRTNLAMQDLYARQGLQIKAADARAAEAQSGINALTLLGASGPSWSSVVGDTSDKVGKGFEQIGKGLGVKAASDEDPRVSEATDLKLENARLQNDWLRATIAKTLNPGSAPAIPPGSLVDGQSDSGTVWRTGAPALEGPPVKMEQKISPPSVYNPGISAGITTDSHFGRSPYGGYVANPPEAYQGIDVPGMLQWNIRNRLYPSIQTLFDERGHPLQPNVKPKPGYYWRLGFDGEWVQTPKFRNTLVGRGYRWIDRTFGR